MAPVPLLFADMTRDALNDLAPTALAVLPVGATEQHGPHLPAGTDAMHAEFVARGAAAAISDRIPVVVTPTLAFGCSPHHLPFGATISLSTETLGRVLRDIGSSIAAAGFRRLFVVNGHGGNHELIQLMARDLALELPLAVAAGSWWAIARDALIAAGAASDGRMPGHAGAFETSVVLALRPELVREPRPDRDGSATGDPLGFWSTVRVESPGSWQRIDGYTDSPARGEAGRGRRFLELAVEAVAGAMLRFARDTAQTPGGQPGRAAAAADGEARQRAATRKGQP